MNVLEEAYGAGLAYVEAYGWRVVALAAAYYFMTPILCDWWGRIAPEDPAERERKRILDTAMRRTRKQQAARMSCEP